MVEQEDDKNTTTSTIFNKYEMGRLLGKGSFAKVHHARHLLSGDSVAIKVIHKDQIRRFPGMMDQVRREIAATRLVRHPNVVALREVMASKSLIYLVMEYVRGGELFAKVAAGRLPEEKARFYFRQLMSAVEHCHGRGVCHRDLKPENLLLDDRENLKVSDFGLSALPEQLRGDGLLHTQCGTPAYVAPEVLRRKGYDGAKADLWSCGVILYVLLAGFLPFQDENLMGMYRKVLKADYQFPPWFSVDARRLLSRLLVVDPNKRISIQQIKTLPWLNIPNSHKTSPSPPPTTKTEEEEDADIGAPRFYNAFELISTMSSGFDLSGMFDGRRGRGGTAFTSRWPAKAIVEGDGDEDGEDEGVQGDDGGEGEDGRGSGGFRGRGGGVGR